MPEPDHGLRIVGILAFLGGLIVGLVISVQADHATWSKLYNGLGQLVALFQDDSHQLQAVFTALENMAVLAIFALALAYLVGAFKKAGDSLQ